ncbi:MAG: HNH endonuclease [Solirubrobacteraceae bacterium]
MNATAMALTSATTTRPAVLNSAARKRRVRMLLERDGPFCCFCGGPIALDAPVGSNGALSIDHVGPRSDGGSNALTNLKLAHRGCNSYHGARRTPASVAATNPLAWIDKVRL